MKTIGNNLSVNRGEVFVFARTIEYSDGRPYVLRSQLENPYLLITVSSNTYRLQGKYFKQYWLDLSEYPKFETAEVKDITSEELEGNTLPTGYTENTCIYRYMTSSNEPEYYRYVGTSPNGAYEPYSFSFIKTFSNSDTREWIESIYLYDIHIVSGETTETYLTETFESLFPDESVPDTIDDMYNAIYKVRPDLLVNVSILAPIVNYITNEIILKTSKIIIDANA